MKSQAVLSHGLGMPGVSGEEKVRAPPTSGGFAKLPGVVPSSEEEGLFPSPGRPKRLARSARFSEEGLESADMSAFPTRVAIECARSGSKGLLSGRPPFREPTTPRQRTIGSRWQSHGTIKQEREAYHSKTRSERRIDGACAFRRGAGQSSVAVAGTVTGVGVDPVSGAALGAERLVALEIEGAVETDEGIGFDSNLALEAAAAIAGVEAACGAVFAAGLEAGFACESAVGMTKLEAAVDLGARESEWAVGVPFDVSADALASVRRVMRSHPSARTPWEEARENTTSSTGPLARVSPSEQVSFASSDLAWTARSDAARRKWTAVFSHLHSGRPTCLLDPVRRRRGNVPFHGRAGWPRYRASHAETSRVSARPFDLAALSCWKRHDQRRRRIADGDGLLARRV